MGTFITILIIGFVIYLIVKSSNKSTNKPTHQTTKKVDLPLKLKLQPLMVVEILLKMKKNLTRLSRLIIKVGF